jgi:hypothetical protein
MENPSNFELKVSPVKKMLPESGYLNKDILQHFFEDVQLELESEETPYMPKYKEKKLFRRKSTMNSRRGKAHENSKSVLRSF